MSIPRLLPIIDGMRNIKDVIMRDRALIRGGTVGLHRLLAGQLARLPPTGVAGCTG